MKKIINVLIMAVIIIASCQPKTKTVPVDTAAIKAEVTSVLDKWHAAYQGKDLTVLMSLSPDDLLFCGPAPNEFWDKPTLYPLFERPFADTSFVISYSIIERNIKVRKTAIQLFLLSIFFSIRLAKKFNYARYATLSSQKEIG